MATIVRNNQGVLINTLSSVGGNFTPSSITGRVFHVVNDRKSPGFYNNWSNIGNVYYVAVDKPIPTNINDDSLKKMDFAKPLFPFNSYIPLIEELIILLNLPSSNSSDVTEQKQSYYLSPINLFNNSNHNSQAVFNIKDDGSIKLGNTVDEKENINTLLPFEGDHIIYGRWGQGLRLSSTLKFNETENFWSVVGDNGDPITLLVNGYKFSEDSLSPYVEDINNDASSIYLTTSQIVPLNTSKIIDKNPLTSPIVSQKYSNNQIILSSERITLNSRKDEVMIFANTNIELGANQTIHLNSSNSILLNSPKIFLGLNSDNRTPTEPALLGAKTVDLLSKLLEALNNFASDVKNNYPPSSLNVYSATLMSQMSILRDKVTNLYSETVFISK